MAQVLSIEMISGEALVSAGSSFSQNYNVQIGGATKSDRNAQTVAIDGMAISIHQSETELTLFGTETVSPLAYMTK